MTTRRLALSWIGASGVAILCAIVGLATGPSDASFWSLVAAARDGTAEGHASARAILIDVRLLRVCGSFAVGAALSLAGVLLQAATRNPIADPYLVGTSAGATFAAVGVATLASALGGGLAASALDWLDWLQPLAAFGGAMAAVSLAFGLARFGGPASPVRVLLAGLVLTAFGGAATSFLLYRASDLQLRAATSWLMGGVVAATPWQLIPAIAVVAIAGVWGTTRAVHLNALGLGEEAARGVGVDDGQMLRVAIWLSSGLAAVAVALAGIIGFVGLLVPHGLRAVVGRDHRALVPCSVLVGGGFLVLADALARVVVAPAELPVGILTALTGCPLLLGLLRNRTRAGSSAQLDVAGSEAEPTPTAADAAEPAEAAQTPETRRNSGTILACEELTLRYPGASEPALREVSLGLRGGELVTLVGPNGCGKSTLLAALAGAGSPTGTIWDGDQRRISLAAVDPRRIAWLPQRLTFEQGTTVSELALLGRTAFLAETVAGRLLGQPSTADRAAVAAAIERVGLTSQRATQLEHLSGGQVQRAFLAMVMAQDAKVLLLDEPTAALDLPTAADVLSHLRQHVRDKNGLAIVAIHDLPLALARADRVIVVAHGRILAVGVPNSPDVMAALVTSFGPGISEFLPGE